MHFIYTVIAFQALSPVIPEASYWIKFQGLNHFKKTGQIYVYIYCFKQSSMEKKSLIANFTPVLCAYGNFCWKNLIQINIMHIKSSFFYAYLPHSEHRKRLESRKWLHKRAAESV